MKIPDLIVFDIKGETIAFSPKYFQFAKIQGYCPQYKVEIYTSDEVQMQFVEPPKDINDAVMKNILKGYTGSRPSKVKGIVVNATTLCRGKCTYCCVEPWLNKTAEFVTYDNLMATLEAHNSLDTIEHIDLYGGEPLLNQPLLEDLLEKTDLDITISSGLFITKKEFERFMSTLDKYGERIQVQLSIDPTNKWRPGKFGGELIYEKCKEILRHPKVNEIRINSIIGQGDTKYREFRESLEEASEKPVYLDFDIVSDTDAPPTKADWWDLLDQVLLDAEELIEGKRERMPFDADQTADVMYRNFIHKVDDFYVDDLCEQMTGEIPVLYPDSAEQHEFRRCQTIPEWKNDFDFVPPNKCNTCPILRYCSAACPYGTPFPSYCSTKLLRVISGAYIMLHKIDLDTI